MRLLARIVSALLILSSIAALLPGCSLLWARRQLRAAEPPLPTLATQSTLSRSVAVASGPVREA